MNALNVIKAINERLAVYERQGLTDSAQYRKIIERIQLEKLPTTTSKTGTIRISRAKADVSKVDNNALTRVENLGGLKQERAKARSKGAKTTREQNEQIKNYGRLEKWAEENLSEIYFDAKAAMVEAEEVQTMFDNGIRNMDYSDIWAVIDRYEKAKSDRDYIFQQSKYWKFDENMSGGNMTDVFNM